MAILLVLLLVFSRNISQGQTVSENCTHLPKEILVSTLGSAFNPRYMSITIPVSRSESNDEFGVKRSLEDEELNPFFVDDTYEKELSQKPAWEFNETPRIKRDSANIMKRLSRHSNSSNKKKLFKPWECKSEIDWIDLGINYFPRYLRSVKCIKKDCYYGHYTCMPRSFTVKILKRITGKCAKISKKFIKHPRMVNYEWWVWEERAINFCCDCTIAY